jgi:predicted ferric reductase
MTAALIAPKRHAKDIPTQHKAAKIDTAIRRTTAAGLWLSLLLVTSWWATDRGVQDLFAGQASAMTSLGRLTGLVASVLLLAQTLAMARVPWIEHAFGQDRLAHDHRILGFTSFNLMLAHIVLITWGYAGGITGTPAMLWDLNWNDPGMLLAVAGTLCLVMVVVTSIRAARRKLRHESWHLLHLYAYLGVGLALPHQLWTGQEFLNSPAKTVFWWSAWVATAAAVLIWRVGTPVALNLRHQLRVSSVQQELPGIWSVYVSGKNLHKLGAEAGQFLSWRFMSGPGWTRANPYSLSAAPDGRSLRLTVQSVGDGSARVRSLKPGTRVLIESPQGRLTSRPRTREKVAFIGAGVGMAPLRSLVEGLDFAPGGAVYIERCHEKGLFTKELETLASERGVEVLRLSGKRRSDSSWLPHPMGAADDATIVKHWVADIADRDVYICGPAQWAKLVEHSLQRCGVPSHQIHSETFEW